MTAPLLDIRDLGKTFTMHLQGGLLIPVVSGVSLTVAAGECVVLGGPSGAGKSSILKMIYGNYRADKGSIRVRHDDAWTELVDAEPRTVLEIRRRTIGFVSQFLRVIPRVAAADVVAEPLIALGAEPKDALDRAQFLLALLNVPQRLWSLPPATFSGGEQQRVNIARSLIVDYPILLLDEPTASLDAGNRDRVIELISERRDAGSAIVGIFHDLGVRELLANRVHEVVPGVAA